MHQCRCSNPINQTESAVGEQVIHRTLPSSDVCLQGPAKPFGNTESSCLQKPRNNLKWWSWTRLTSDVRPSSPPGGRAGFICAVYPEIKPDWWKKRSVWNSQRSSSRWGCANLKLCQDSQTWSRASSLHREKRLKRADAEVHLHSGLKRHKPRWLKP